MGGKKKKKTGEEEEEKERREKEGEDSFSGAYPISKKSWTLS
jgi:hypothetical protein